MLVQFIQPLAHCICTQMEKWFFRSLAILFVALGAMDDPSQWLLQLYSTMDSILLVKLAPLWNWIELKVDSIPVKHKKHYNPSPWRWIRRPSIRYKLLGFTVVAMAAAAKPRERITLFDTDSQVVGVDNRCSACISHIPEDFIPGSLRPCNRVSIKGYGGARITGNIQIGTLLWKFQDDSGVMHYFKIPNSYFVPQGGMRLLSIQHWAKVQKDPVRLGTGGWTGPDDIYLWWKGRKHQLTIPLDPASNVGDLYLAPGYLGYKNFCQSQCVDPDTLPPDAPIPVNPTLIPPDEEEEEPPELVEEDYSDEWQTETQTENPRTFSLSGPSTEEERKKAPTIITDEEDQQEASSTLASELLRLHQCFGHLSFTKLQWMAKKGIIPKRLAKCQQPFCSPCAYAKATKRPWRSREVKNSIRLVPVTKPGQVVSVDQLVSPAPGLIAQMTGFLFTKERYKYATIFVDHYSGLGFVYLQKGSSAAETIEAKKAFERYAEARGVTIRAYHADNGIFKANEWQKECIRSNQQLTFAGVGAHHQNGRAEKRIRDLQEMTRTILVHANRRWPKAVTIELWPYALKQANLCINAAPNLQHKKRLSPNQLFESHEVEINPKHWKPFGCPVYVLDEPLQTGKPFGKWKSRAKIGVYLGQSPVHNRTVALVLNPETGYVSPQFHVKFDSSFHSKDQINLSSKWQQKTGFVWSPPQQQSKRQREYSNTQRESSKKQSTSGKDTSRKHPSAPFQRAPKRVRLNPNLESTSGPEGDSILPQQSRASPSSTAAEQPAPASQEVGTAPREQAQKNGPIAGRTRSQDESSNPARMMSHEACIMEAMLAEIDHSVDTQGELFCHSLLFPQDEPQLSSEESLDAQRRQCTEDEWCMNTTAQIISEYARQCKKDPLFKQEIMVQKATSDPDTMYRHEAMREPDYNEFLKAMEKEVQDQMGNGNFTLVPRHSIPKTATLLPAVWQMKRKRDIRTRAIKKYKARLNVDGSRMKKGIHYDLTYSPVAAWSSIRLILALAATHNWYTKQIDYVLAFPQAPVERPLYMEIPKGIEFEGKPSRDWVLKLDKNVYGQKQAGRVWNRYLTAKLVKDVGFKQSDVDECIFFKGTVIYVLYTDDSILVGPSEAEINQVIQQIKDAGLRVTEEGNLEDFLGVNIHKDESGVITFSQPHLIDKILKALHMDKTDLKPKSTPAAMRLLSRHSDSPNFNNSFHYSSVIGMCNYLDKGSRSDIAFATHQCARFSSNPKEEHAAAVRWLARYLKGTRDKGMTFRPKPDLGLEVFVDSDFAGNWDPKETQDKDTARSRYGFIIRYNGCPIVWKSKLATEIALSTTEAEYIGLSYALRDAIPMMELLKELKKAGFPVTPHQAKVHCKVFEDNSGAIEIAKEKKFRPRTKHINCRFHHFRSYIDSKEISIHYISSEDQPADYLTKPVNEGTLLKLRQFIMGW